MQALALSEKVYLSASRLLCHVLHLNFTSWRGTLAVLLIVSSSACDQNLTQIHRRYCECYQHGQPCHSRCTCVDCGNNGQHAFSIEVRQPAHPKHAHPKHPANASLEFSEEKEKEKEEGREGERKRNTGERENCKRVSAFIARCVLDKNLHGNILCLDT